MIAFIRRNPALAAGVRLPVMVMLLFMLATFIPRWTVTPPAYDFLFTIEQSLSAPGDVEIRFSPGEGRLKAFYRTASKDRPLYSVAHLFRYSTAAHAVQEIALPAPETLASTLQQSVAMGGEGVEPEASSKEAQWKEIALPRLEGIVLDTRLISPDGYRFSNEYSGGGSLFSPFFGYGYRAGLSLIKQGNRINIEGPGSDRYAYYNAHFLGWVIPPEKRP